MLSHLPTQVNGLALGIGGLGILWRDVVTIYGFEKTWNSPNTVPGILSHSFAYLCHTATAFILMSYAAKAFVHRELFWVEMRSFPKVASLATGPMALATVCTSLVRVSVAASQVVWLLALVLHLTCGAFYLVGIYQRTAFTKLENLDESSPKSEVSDDAVVRRTSDWTPHSPCQLDKTTPPKFVKVVETSSPWNPAAFPPTVGIAALGSCSTGIGFPIIALATLLIGVGWAIIILSLIVFQTLKSKSVDKQARAVILCAPYALCGAAFWAVRRQFEIEEAGPEDAMSNTLYVFLNVMALLLYLVVLSMAPLLWRQGEVAAPGCAAFTFPTVIVATCLVRSSDNPSLDPPLGHQVTQAIAWVACIIATIVVFGAIGQFVLYFRRMRPASENIGANSKVSDSGQISEEPKQVADKSEPFELQDDELHDPSYFSYFNQGVKNTPVTSVATSVTCMV
jgi:hypothetical protein